MQSFIFYFFRKVYLIIRLINHQTNGNNMKQMEINVFEQIDKKMLIISLVSIMM